MTIQSGTRLGPYQERSTFLISLAVDPMLDPLRSNRRFQELRRRVGPPEN
jgi:hypothetical protein